MKFNFFALFLLIAVAFVSCQEKVAKDLDCRHCDLASCPLPGKCHAGVVRDICGCCEICGLEEGQLCNFSPTKDGQFWHGFCGAGMECRKRKDIKAESQSTCVCDKSGLVCATDGVTYTHCQMAAVSSKSDKHITQKHEGPCLTRPKIVSSSESATVEQGMKHTILCEVQGYPLPSITWLFVPQGKITPDNLPGDAEEISSSVRGGPEKMRITGFLQITDFQLKHEGVYECVADGPDGIASKKIALVFKKHAKTDL